MSKSVNQLWAIWNHEKEEYKSQEVGTGTQRFVREVLQNEETFNLIEGKLATPIEERENEFICEKRAKEGRRADFAIYINSDIVIPIEVEQYTAITRGEKQLAQYQTDFEKKYGILTDGYTWRFYNNTFYRSFTLEQILHENDYFQEFWKEYVKLENYYLSFFEPSGQLKLIGKAELDVEENRKLFFEDITTLIRSLRNKLRIEGYFDGLDKTEAVKKASEITYAYIIQFILYKTLVDNKFEEFTSDYTSRIESIHKAVKNHSYKEILGVADGISIQISQNIYRPFAMEQEQIRNKLTALLQSANNELSEVSPWLDIVVFIKKYCFLNVRNDIFGFVYENYLKELSEDENRGQYFTDPLIVNYMLQQVGYNATEIREKLQSGKSGNLSIVDPACGSGTFLYSATSELINSFSAISKGTAQQIEELIGNNIFGLDIAEFPLYLAEMSILMRMLPLIIGAKYNNPLEKKIKVFLTKDSIAEFIGAELNSTDTDTHAKGGQLSYFGRLVQPVYPSYVRDEQDLVEMKDSMSSFPRRRFDYVVANPPYIGYNECSKRGILSFSLLKGKKIHLSDIYGINLHSVPERIKKRPPKPNFFAFFLALGLGLLKDNGKLCFIIPQTLLNNGDLDVLRYHLAKNLTINKIITFNSYLFIDRGLDQAKTVPTSSLILVVTKKPPVKQHKVRIDNFGTGSINELFAEGKEAKSPKSKDIIQLDLLNNCSNWNYIRHEPAVIKFYNEYMTQTSDLTSYYEHTKADRVFKSRFYFDIGYDIDERLVLEEPPSQQIYYGFPKLSEQNYGIHDYRGFWPNIRAGKNNRIIGLLQANQGYNLLDSKYKVIWSYMNPQRFYFTDMPVIWPRNRMCAIGSDNKREIMYLFALLNSSVTKRILKWQVETEQEKDLLISIASIKEYIRTPNIAENIRIKEQIIQSVEELLSAEDSVLSLFVDFSSILLQEFDRVEVSGKTLVLTKDKAKSILKIEGKTDLIATLIASKCCENGLYTPFKLNELRNLQVIDSQRQELLKRFIDDLVFALYFNVPLSTQNIRNESKTHIACADNKFYKLV